MQHKYFDHGELSIMEIPIKEDANMGKRNDTTVAIAGRRKERLNDAVVKLVMARKESVKISEIVHFLIDTYLDEAVKDMLAEEKMRQREDR